MRITAGLIALTVGLGLPGIASADEEIASFNTRWPEAAMRKPTLSELVHLVSGAVKRDIKPVIEAENARGQTSTPCIGEICQLLNSR